MYRKKTIIAALAAGAVLTLTLPAQAANDDASWFTMQMQLTDGYVPPANTDVSARKEQVAKAKQAPAAEPRGSKAAEDGARQRIDNR